MGLNCTCVSLHVLLRMGALVSFPKELSFFTPFSLSPRYGAKLSLDISMGRVRQSAGAREQCSKAASSFVGSRGKKRGVNKERKKRRGKKRKKEGKKEGKRKKKGERKGSKNKRIKKKESNKEEY